MIELSCSGRNMRRIMAPWYRLSININDGWCFSYDLVRYRYLYFPFLRWGAG